MLALLAATAVFTVKQTAGAWTFQSPEGQSFWSLGVCCTDPGIAPAKLDLKNPGYSGLAHYPTETAWADATAKSLRSWGFNSLGGWSDANLFKGKSAMPFFPVLHLGAYDQAPWHDMFAPQFMKAIDGAAKDQILKLRDDPNLVGYFTDNELGWWGDTLLTSYFTMPATAPGKQRLVARFRTHYQNDFARLQCEWETDAKDFTEFANSTKIHLKPGGSGINVSTEWTGELARHYYRSVRDAVRRYDTRHLILGDRYCQYYDPAVAAASKGLIDVASTNLGAEWNDGSISHFFLDTLYRLTGRPIVISEFYMAAMENRSGNQNSSGGFPVVQTQTERAAAFNRYVQDLIRRPYIIGAHWFQFYDEPTHGRGDGENYNMGLVDIKGQPYEELTAAARNLKRERGSGHSQSSKSFATSSRASLSDGAPWSEVRAEGGTEGEGVLTATAKVRFDVYADGSGGRSERKLHDAMGRGMGTPPAPIAPLKDLKGWPRDRAFVPALTPAPTADLYATWEDGYLDVGLFAMDFTDEKLYPGGKIPESERPRLQLKIENRLIDVRYGGEGRKATCSDPKVQLSELPGLKHTLLLRVPSKGMAKGKKISLTATWEAHSRARRADWKLNSVASK